MGRHAVSEQKFFELGKKYFAYLEQYGFRLAQEIDRGGGVAELNWESRDCRISVSLDKGQVLLYAGPLAPPDLWYDVGHVVEYVTHGTERWVYTLPAERKDYDDWLRRQLDRLARMLRPYCERICPLFSPEVFPETRRELRRLMGLER